MSVMMEASFDDSSSWAGLGRPVELSFAFHLPEQTDTRHLPIKIPEMATPCSAAGWRGVRPTGGDGHIFPVSLSARAALDTSVWMAIVCRHATTPEEAFTKK
jgi:hypothetical protein